MIKLGITGGIGSGKTTVARILEDFGVPVYYADDKAKELMSHYAPLKQQIIDLFGPASYQDNRLNTSYIAGIVFDNKQALADLEALVHPAVKKDFLVWVAQQKSPVVAVENAILHKSGMDQLVDMIVLVTTDAKKRMERVMKRDKMSADQVKKRIINQEDSSDLLKKSDYVINNTGSLKDLTDKVLDLLLKVKIMLNKS